MKLTNCNNEAIRNYKFPDSLKLSDITPVYKKFDPSDKANYRPVSALPLFFLLGFTPCKADLSL